MYICDRCGNMYPLLWRLKEHIDSEHLGDMKENLPISFEVEIDEILARTKEIILKKNQKYGQSFDKQVERYGYAGMMIPLRNKIDRLDTLLKEETEDSEESIEDSLDDLIGYAVLSRRLRKQKG